MRTLFGPIRRRSCLMSAIEYRWVLLQKCPPWMVWGGHTHLPRDVTRVGNGWGIRFWSPRFHGRALLAKGAYHMGFRARERGSWVRFIHV